MYILICNQTLTKLWAKNLLTSGVCEKLSKAQKDKAKGKGLHFQNGSSKATETFP